MIGPSVVLDDMPSGCFHLFAHPAHVVTANNAAEVQGAFQSIERLVRLGFHVAGYLSYELGYALEPRLMPLMPAVRAVPLLWFGAFRKIEEIASGASEEWFDSHVRGRAYAGPLRWVETFDSYVSRFCAIRDYIAAGDIYQANLTFPAQFAFLGDPLVLYRRLRRSAQARHGAFIFDGDRHILSLSPELFFSIAGGTITARPMKGTAPRGTERDEDVKRQIGLAGSVKDQAENLMIVDLIRNDLGRIAKTGSVRVDELFAVETYPTLHQMVSTVRATLREGTTPGEIIAAIFPCGSITGAPKMRAMEIIREVEPCPRGVYCGAIGHFSPDGNARFNVAIRTLTIANGLGTLGVGSGVVADSEDADEYAECLLKSRYYTINRPEISLIETLRFEPRFGLIRGTQHLQRMARAAKDFGIAFDGRVAERKVNAATQDLHMATRVRLELKEDGLLDLAISEALAVPEHQWTYAIARHRVQSGDALSHRKTSWRTEIEEEFLRLRLETGCDQVIFLNERSEVVEGNVSNVFLQLQGQLLTPPLSSGPLDGVFRRALLDNNECTEAVIQEADLRSGRVYFGNSLRGLVAAKPVTQS